MKVIGAALLLAAIHADALLHATTPCTKCCEPELSQAVNALHCDAMLLPSPCSSAFRFNYRLAQSLQAIVALQCRLHCLPTATTACNTYCNAAAMPSLGWQTASISNFVRSLLSCVEFLELTDSAVMHVYLHCYTQMSSLRSNLQSIRSSSSSSRSSRHPQLHMAVKPSTKAADVSTSTTSAKLLTNADNLRLSTKQVSSGVIQKAAAGAAAQGVQGVQQYSDNS
eukprot:15210-Heterococcus_DN1.PRE.3